MSPQLRSGLATGVAAVVVALGVLGVYLIVLMFAGGTAGLREPGPAPVLVATVLVALGMQPAFVRLRRFLQARLGASSVAPFELLSRLPKSVTGELPAEEIPQHMVRVLAEGLRTHRTSLWLRAPDGFRLAASWPPATAEPHAEPDAQSPPGQRSIPISHQGEVLAGLQITHLPPRTLSRLEQRLVDAYANQAGQVVGTFSLRASLEARRSELAEQTTALQAARRQLLETQEVERRLLERDLHDGAQSQLLALALGVRLARQLADQAPGRTAALIERSAGQARDIATSLTALSSGLTPRLLRTEGLAAALRATLASAEIPVVVENRVAIGHEPLAVPVAEGLYYVVVEAAQNATKHAHTNEVWIGIDQGEHRVTVTVRDHGRGFDSDAVDFESSQTGRGHRGLTNMAERVTALGGRLEVDSGLGRGTVITARVPLDGNLV